MKEIFDHVEYLNGLLGEYEKYSIVDVKDDFNKARKSWDENFYEAGGGGDLYEEKYIDKEGKEWYLLLRFEHD